jgi:hypothetical protein
MQDIGQAGFELNLTKEHIMRTTTYNAAVRDLGTPDTTDALKVAKNIALFAAAPFIGLAYAAAFPFVAVGLIAWYGIRAARKHAGAA